jgi:hypothetical protein
MSLYILKNHFCYKNLFVLFFNLWFKKGKGVAKFWQWERKSSFKSFPTIKMDLFFVSTCSMLCDGFVDGVLESQYYLRNISKSRKR